MNENCCGVSVGHHVPDFRMETYEAGRGEFGEVELSSLKEKGKWTVLFFYPADFTFV